jgi:RimJ/RimL family protein N-acetyltransferase
VRLLRYSGDPAQIHGRPIAPGWPHDDTADALAFTAGGAWTWLIVDDDGRIAGECGVKAPPDDVGTVEIGYGLAPGSRGRGLGGRALTALLAELWASPAVRRIEAEVHPSNVPSRRLLEGRGFALTGVEPDRLRYAADR